MRAYPFQKIIFAGVCALLPFSATAATLSFFSAIETLVVNETVTVDIYAESAEEPVNAISGTVAFPANLLAVKSVSKKESALDWWTMEPALPSDGEGTISFEGVALKGFSGPKKKILSVTFKGIAPGSARLSFSAGSVLANDGSGNNVLSAMQEMRLTVREPRRLSVNTANVAKAVTPDPEPAITPKKEISATPHNLLLAAPAINVYSLTKGFDMPLIIGRSAHPHAIMRTFFTGKDEVVRIYETRADYKGDFIVDPNAQLPSGTYTAWTEAADGRGGRSIPSNTVTVTVPAARLPIAYAVIAIAAVILIAGRPEPHPSDTTQLNT